MPPDLHLLAAVVLCQEAARAVKQAYEDTGDERILLVFGLLSDAADATANLLSEREGGPNLN